MSISPFITRTKSACRSCSYVIPSETASTDLRCGFDDVNRPALFQKFDLRHSCPEVKVLKACDSWKASKFGRSKHW